MLVLTIDLGLSETTLLILGFDKMGALTSKQSILTRKYFLIVAININH